MAAPIRVKDLVAGQNIITVSVNDNVEQVLAKFTTNHILSAPVEHNGEWIGLVDMLDILRFAILVSQEAEESRTTPISTRLTDDDMDMLLHRMHNFSLSTLQNSALYNLSNQNPLVTISAEATLDEALEKFSQGIHRLVVVKKEDDEPAPKPIGILTQSALIQHLAQYVDERVDPATSEKTLQELGLVTGPDSIVSVSESSFAIDAFFLMYERGTGAVAVIDEAGKLVGNLSATDLKLIRRYRFGLLLLTVKQFIEESRKEQQEEPAKSKDALVYVVGECCLKMAISKLAEKKVHRLYIVDKEDRPVGVVSLSDISRILACRHGVSQ